MLHGVGFGRLRGVGSGAPTSARAVSRSRVTALTTRAATLVVLATLTACSGGERGAHRGAAWLTEQVHPRNLHLTLDTAAMAMRIVTPEGGTLEAVGEDGTYYELTIPKGALERDTRIKLIPVHAIDGLPFGGAAPAVQLEPEGLQLLRPATLSIEPQHPVPLAEQAAFAYAGAGEDAHLYPARGDSVQVEFDLLHFSGYGFGRAAPGDPGVEMLAEAADHTARLEARVAWFVRVAKRQAERGDETAMTTLIPHLEQLYVEYFDTVLRPLMQAAEKDDRMAECAIERYFVWARQLLLLGLVRSGSDDESTSAARAAQQQPTRAPDSELDRRYDEARSSWIAIMENEAAHAMPRADRACREAHDFRAYTRVIALERRAQLLGLHDESGVLADVLRHLQACMTFEIELVSVIDSRTPTGGSTFHVAATAPITVGAATADNAPLRYVEYTATGRPKEDLFGKNVKVDDDDFVAQGIGNALEMMNTEISAAGTRNGTIRVLELRPAPDTADVQMTGCSGQDTTVKAEVDSTWRVVLEIDAPVEITRHTPLHKALGKPFTQETHEWLRFFRQFRKEDLVYTPGEPTISEADGGPTAQQMVIEVTMTAPGTWRAELETPDPDAPPHLSLTEHGHLVLRHTPR